MSPRKKTFRETDAPKEPSDEVIPGEAPPEVTQEDMDDVLGQLPNEGAVILIWRQERRTGQWEYCEEVPAQGYTIDQLRATWGAGKYKMRFRERVSNRWLGSKTFNVAAPAGSPPLNGPVAAVPVAAAPNDRMDRLIDAMLARAMAPSDTFEKAMQALAALSPVLIAVVQRQGGNPVETATQLAALMRDNGAKGSSVELASEMLKTFREGMTIGRSLNGAPEASWMDVARDFLPPILGVLQNGQAQQAPGSVTIPPVSIQPAPQGPAVPPGGPVAVIPPPEGSPVATPTRSGFYAAFKPFVPRLREAARDGEDPDELAYNLVGFVSGWQRDLLADAAARDDWMTEPFVQYPELEPARLWVTRFLEAVRQQFTPEGEEEAPPPPAPPKSAAAKRAR